MLLYWVNLLAILIGCQYRKPDMCSPSALSLYDIMLMFSKELRCIWKRKFGTGAILYLFIRYATFLNMFIQVLSDTPYSKTAIVSSTLNPHFCQLTDTQWSWVPGVSTPFPWSESRNYCGLAAKPSSTSS